MIAKATFSLPFRASLVSLQKFQYLTLIVAVLGFLGSEIGRAEIYVSNATADTVTVYADSAQGNAAPIRILQGPDTELDFPQGIALDLIHSELFLVPQSTIAKINVYPLNVDGNQAPIRTIEGANTGIESPAGIAVDPVNNELYVSSYSNASIRVFTRTANGNVSPVRVIEGSETGFTGPVGIFIDLEHDEIFVTNLNLDSGASGILVFSRTADGNVQPIRSLEGPSVLLQLPQWIFVSQQHDELYVSDQLSSINVYPRTADGDVAPIRSIAGPSTMIATPLGILLTADGELLLANAGGDAILVFPRLADGDFVPSRIIAGGATGLAAPYTLGSTIAAEGSVGYAGPLCQPEMGLICPPSGDPQVWIDGLDVQINGGVFTPPPCEPVARINWDWGDETSSDSFFPAVHTYPERTEYTITAVALDAGDTEIIRASCDISLQVIFGDGFEALAFPVPEPRVSASSPASPADDNNPKIIGSAEAGTTINLYSDSTCSDFLASGTANDFNTTGITINVIDDSVTTVYASATDDIGTVSPCSRSFVTYTDVDCDIGSGTWAAEARDCTSSDCELFDEGRYRSWDGKIWCRALITQEFDNWTVTVPPGTTTFDFWADWGAWDLNDCGDDVTSISIPVCGLNETIHKHGIEQHLSCDVTGQTSFIIEKEEVACEYVIIGKPYFY